jgi:ankyrin repeat protein
MNSSNKYISKLYSYFELQFYMSDEAIENCINKIPKTKINFSDKCREFEKDGETILYMACKYKKPQSLHAIKLLLSKGADPNIESKLSLHTPLMAAFFWQYPHLENDEILNDIIDELIKPEHNVDIGYTNQNGTNALYLACKNNKSHIAMKLLNTGLSNPCPDVVGRYQRRVGHDALYYAFDNNMEDVVLLILELCPQLSNKKYIEVINYAGDYIHKTAYEFALDKGMTRVAQLLNPLANVIHGIQSNTKTPFNDPEAVFLLDEYLNGEITARETRVSLGGNKKRKNRKTQKKRN